MEIKQRIEVYTSEIQKSLVESDWDALNALLLGRQEELENFFCQLGGSDKNKELVTWIQGIQLQDDKFSHLIQEKRKFLEKEVSSLKQGKKSVQSYLQVKAE